MEKVFLISVFFIIAAIVIYMVLILSKKNNNKGSIDESFVVHNEKELHSNIPTFSVPKSSAKKIKENVRDIQFQRTLLRIIPDEILEKEEIGNQPPVEDIPKETEKGEVANSFSDYQNQLSEESDSESTNDKLKERQIIRLLKKVDELKKA